ncbi:Hypp800 [Branchiostoma lanceolatum]|uniref:Hypp800 protein n=1 Tax=Branchiostoma lanceolatum TaxID=7740 RepID=A0A8J9YKD1_BRALA|nr:Hypp800 [Branchiostoma lanceolatum]
MEDSDSKTENYVLQLIARALRTTQVGIGRLRGHDLAPNIGNGIGRLGLKSALLTALAGGVNVLSDVLVDTEASKDERKDQSQFADILILPRGESERWNDSPTPRRRSSDIVSTIQEHMVGYTEPEETDSPSTEEWVAAQSHELTDRHNDPNTKPGLPQPSPIAIEAPWVIVINLVYISASFARVGVPARPAYRNPMTGKRFGLPNYSDQEYLQENANRLVALSMEDLLNVKFHDLTRGIITIMDKRQDVLKSAVAQARKLQVRQDTPVYACAVIAIGPRVAQALWTKLLIQPSTS